MKCPHCRYEDQAHPKYCPNCGRLNEDDVGWNVVQINESAKYRPPTEEDVRFMADAKKYFTRAAHEFSKVDMRTPAEIWATRLGWITETIGIALLALSLVRDGQPSAIAIALMVFAGGLLGLVAMLTGKVRLGIRAAIMIPILLVGGLIMLVALAWNALFPDMGPVRDQKSAMHDCYRWDKVTPSMVGTSVCVYGKILKYTVGTTTADIYFGNKPSDFHLISTNYEFPNAEQGQCVRASGTVSSSYGALVIDISNLTLVTPFSECETWP